MKKRANPRAGQGLLHSTVGRQTRNPGYKPGEHWVLCQRCGFNYYSRDILREWTGAIVCKSCWEPRHPQDFVRTRAERIQAPGPTNSDGLTNQTATEGSTDLPTPTFNLGGVTVSSIADQSYDAGNTISTITGAVFTTSFLDTYNETITISSYSATNLPDSISISASTGAITGTLDNDSWDQTGIVTEVTALYSNGQSWSTTFTWTIANAGIAPDAVANTCWGWWDFSESAGNYCKQNSNDTTAVTDESDIKRVNSRCGSGNHLIPDQTNEAGYTGVWDANVRNGHGAFLPVADNGTTDVSTLENDAPVVGGMAQPFTVIGVVKTPDTLYPEGNWWFGPTLSNGHNFGISPDETGNVGSWEVSRTNPTGYFSIDVDALDLNSRAGEWYIWYNEVPTDPLLGTRTYSGDTAPTPHAVDTVGVGSSGVRLGAKNLHSTTVPYYGWNSYIGEVIMYEGTLTAADKTGLELYLSNKWALTDEI